MTSRQQVTPPDSSVSWTDNALMIGVVAVLAGTIAYYLFFSEDAEVKAPAESTPLEEPR